MVHLEGNNPNNTLIDRDIITIGEKGVGAQESYNMTQRSQFLLENALRDGHLSPEEILYLKQRFLKEKEEISHDVKTQWESFLDEIQPPDNIEAVGEKQQKISRHFVTVQRGDTLWKIVKESYPELQTNQQIVQGVNALVHFQKNPSLKTRLLQDSVIVGGKPGKDGVLGDTLYVGDRIELPKIEQLFAS